MITAEIYQELINLHEEILTRSSLERAHNQVEQLGQDERADVDCCSHSVVVVLGCRLVVVDCWQLAGHRGTPIHVTVNFDFHDERLKILLNFN